MKKLTLLVACAVVLLIPAGGNTEPSCSAAVDPSSGTAGDLLLAVAGAPDRATAVGIHYVGGDGTPLVLERSSDTWTNVRVPTHPGARLIQLQDATVAGSRVWVVGAFRNDRPEAGWVRNGTWHWTTVPIDPGDGEDEFLGVAALPDGTVVAVGMHQVGANYQPLIEAYDGQRWSVIPSPPVHGSAVLKDVAVGKDGVVHAVGWVVLEGGRTVPFAERLDGTEWVAERLPGTGLLSGVAIEPNGTPIAVGWRTTSTGDETITMRYEGSWKAVDAATDQPGRLDAATTGSSTLAVGSTFVDGVPRPSLLRLEDGWAPVAIGGEPAPENGGDQLLGITGDPGSFVAVGIRDTTDAFASLAVTGDCVG